MTILSISTAPELLKIDGTEKIPTGGKGDFSVSLKKVSDFAVENAGKVFDPKIDLKADKTDIPTNEMIAAMEKEDRFVITETGQSQRELNKTLVSGLAVKADKDYVDQLVINANAGLTNYLTEAELLATRPTSLPHTGKALDTKKVWIWDGEIWNDTGLSELDLAKKEIVDNNDKLKSDFIQKHLASSNEILLAITDDLGNLTWLQVDKQTGLPTNAVIEVLREINQLAVEDEITTLNGEKIAVSIKDKNGNLTALTVRESDGMFIDEVINDIANRLGVTPDSNEVKSYNTPININILRSISSGIIRHTEKTPLPATPYNFTDSTGQESRIYLPSNYDNSTPIPLVIVFDGVGGSSTPTVRDSYLPLLEQGVALCKSQGHGDSYGNPACMQSYLELFKKSCEIAPIGAVILVGNSMGGIAAQNALLTGAIPNVAGLYLTDPTYSLRQRYDNGRKTEIATAYNIAVDGSDYAEKTKGYDPALRHWSQYMGLPIHIRASSGDTAVRLSEHGQKLKDYLSIHNDVTLIDTGTAGHNTADRFDATDLFSFIQKCTKI